jgi:cytochrome c peroxidase
VKYKVLIFIASFVVISFKIRISTEDSAGVQNTMNYFSTNVSLFTKETEDLITSLELIRKDDPLSVERAKNALKKCRLAFKKIEFFTEYFFHSETQMYNAPPQYEVEEPTLEYVEPMGLQQIESLLFKVNAYSDENKQSLLVQAKALHDSVKDLKALLYNYQINDKQVMESLRIEVLRMITLSITGFDARYLKTGIRETMESTKAIQFILKPYLIEDPLMGNPLDTTIKNSIQYLKEHLDFDSFNRMEYLTRFALPLQGQLDKLIKSLALELNTTQFLNYDVNIFNPNALKDWGLDVAPAERRPMIVLGEKLFFDKALSGNLVTSCAKCHQPENHYADSLVRSPSLQLDMRLKRNTPTLLYAGRQHVFFLDGRSNTLRSQLKDVILNPMEMDGKEELLYRNILFNHQYKKLLNEAFPKKRIKDMGIDEITLALAAYIKQLEPMNSAFDHYIDGDVDAMSKSQIRGFNLFMGKARCGTCHFAPYFNSLAPPLYESSEVEVLGTPDSDDFDHPLNDDDMGRFDLYQVPYYRRAFKTPTIRNAEKTAPYMHNGGFKSLRSVLDFYNKGGGTGLRLNIPNQTLPSEPLNLSEKEMQDITQFINALTDRLNIKQTN